MRLPRSGLTLLLALCLAALMCALVFYTPRAKGEPLFIGNHGEHVITLTNEPCALKAVTNMPSRATWREPDGRVWESCYGLSRETMLVVLYCGDLTVQIVP